MTIEEIRANINNLTVEQLKAELESRERWIFYELHGDTLSDATRRVTREVIEINRYIELKEGE